MDSKLTSKGHVDSWGSGAIVMGGFRSRRQPKRWDMTGGMTTLRPRLAWPAIAGLLVLLIGLA